VEDVNGKVISPRALQEHWFRVTDESGTIHEFSLNIWPAGWMPSGAIGSINSSIWA